VSKIIAEVPGNGQRTSIVQLPRRTLALTVAVHACELLLPARRRAAQLGTRGARFRIVVLVDGRGEELFLIAISGLFVTVTALLSIGARGHCMDRDGYE
jgi:hypothetical protein